MSDTSAGQVKSRPPIPAPGESFVPIPDGLLKTKDGEKKIEPLNPQTLKANPQTSKGWHVTAIVVGILLVLGGVFGGLGLLQAHYHFLPSSFDWLAKAVEFVGNVGPNHVILWALAAGGVVGIGAIAKGSYGVHKARREAQKEVNRSKSEEDFPKPILNLDNFEPNIMPVGEDKKGVKPRFKAKEAEDALRTESPKHLETNDRIANKEVDVSNNYSGKKGSNAARGQNNLALDPKVSAALEKKQKALEAKQLAAEEQRLEAMLSSDNFGKLNEPAKTYEDLDKTTYTERYFCKPGEKDQQGNPIPEDRDDRFFVVIKDGDGNIKCSERITEEQEGRLVAHLKNKKGYKKHVVKKN